jgi:hypothetical protein
VIVQPLHRGGTLLRRKTVIIFVPFLGAFIALCPSVRMEQLGFVFVRLYYIFVFFAGCMIGHRAVMTASE